MARCWKNTALHWQGSALRLCCQGRKHHLFELARPEVRVRVRLLALDDLPDDGDAGGAQELVQLSEVVALLERRDAERTLLRTPGPLGARAVRLGGASMAAAVLQVL